MSCHASIKKLVIASFDQADSDSDQSIPALSASVGKIELTTATSHGIRREAGQANRLFLIEPFGDRLLNAYFNPAKDRRGDDHATIHDH